MVWSFVTNWNKTNWNLQFQSEFLNVEGQTIIKITVKKENNSFFLHISWGYVHPHPKVIENFTSQNYDHSQINIVIQMYSYFRINVSYIYKQFQIFILIQEIQMQWQQIFFGVANTCSCSRSLVNAAILQIWVLGVLCITWNS